LYYFEMVSIKNAIEQMAWADIKLFNCLKELPIEAWKSKPSADDWNVGALTFHLIASADWYAFTLGRNLHFSKEPESIEEIFTLGELWKEFNNFLIQECDKEDEPLSYVEDGKTHTLLRSTALVQAVIHSSEHRAQIALALKINGFNLPALQDFSVWAYLASKK